MNINKKLIKYNFTPNSNSPKYCVIHDTGNRDAGANAEMHYQYFNSGDKNASAHFFIDDAEILQLIEIKDSSWHCGDGMNKYGIGNKNSIGIEICINNDGDYNKAIENAIELVIMLMTTYNIPLENIVRHYDASRKNCPQSMNVDGNWTGWKEFKQKLEVMVMENNRHWAADSRDYLIANGIIVKEERYDDKITRGEVFALLAQILHMMKGDR